MDQIAKNDRFSKKAKKANLKAEFGMSYEAQSCSAQKITIIKYPLESRKIENFAVNERFFRANMCRGLNLGLYTYWPSKNAHLQLNFLFCGFVKGTLFL